MIKQPINAFRGQASELEIQRKEIRNTKQQTLDVLSKGIGKSIEEIEKDINRPKYFDPWEAVEYGLIDQVSESIYITHASTKKNGNESCVDISITFSAGSGWQDNEEGARSAVSSITAGDANIHRQLEHNRSDQLA